MAKKKNTNHPWKESYPSSLDWKTPIPVRPLFSLFDEAAERFADRPAVDFMGCKYTYEQIEALVNRFAKGLQELGVEKGTRVGLFLPNCPQFIISYFAVLKAGGTVVNYNPLYSIGELKAQLEDSATDIIITLNLATLYSKVNNLMQTTTLDKVIVARIQDALPFPKNLLYPLCNSSEIAPVLYGRKNISFTSLLKNKGDVVVPEIDPDKDIAVLQYTGGTTGVPKGAMLTHDNLYSNAMQMSLWLNHLHEGQERILGVLPLFHAFAMGAIMNLGIKKGAELILHPKFDLSQVFKDIAKKQITVMAGVPTMFVAMNQKLAEEEHDMSSLHLCVSGGAPLPVDVCKTFETNVECALIEGYGMTECSPVVTINPIDPSHRKVGSVGLPLPNTKITIENMEDRGKFLPVGKDNIGEICISGPQVMTGYLDNPEATKERMVSGCFRTGDIGYMDEEGYVFIVDRLKELIISSGNNIYPRNVEEALYKHSKILEAAVIGVPDEYKGQKVKACIVLQPYEELTEDEIKKFLSKKLAKFEVPSEIEFYESLPKTLIGKIDKKAL